MERLYDMIIIGSGPAGMTAGIYAGRAGLSTLLLEGYFMHGGQIINTYEVDNYPGLPGISGMDLAEKMKNHLTDHGVQIVQAKVEEITFDGEIKILHTAKGIYRAKTVVLAAGAVHRKLEVPGEDKFTGMGVSYCATCDGAFFKDKVVAVIGGGNSAVEDALLLARKCKKVTIIHRRDELRAVNYLQQALKDTPSIDMCWNHVVTEIGGENQVKWIRIKDTITGEEEQMDVDGVFVATGLAPDTGFVKDLITLDKGGYIVAGEDGRTNIPGIYAAGDIRTKQLRQVVTAVADGANCVTSAEEYLRDFKG